MNKLDTYRHKGLRKELAVKLSDKGISDIAVLHAVETVARHLFFGNDSIFFETQAYEDKAFPIGEGQTISQPFTVAYQSELLQVNPKEKILEIGTGSGYQAAVLGCIGARVFTIERHRIRAFTSGLKNYWSNWVTATLNVFLAMGLRVRLHMGHLIKLLLLRQFLNCLKSCCNN